MAHPTQSQLVNADLGKDSNVQASVYVVDVHERTLRVLPPQTVADSGLVTVGTFEEAAKLLRGDTDAVGQINHIRVLADQVAQHAKASSTRANYRYWWGRFERFCSDPESRRHLNNVPVAFQVLPADPKLVVAFLTDLITEPPQTDPDAEEWQAPAPGTLDNIISAINHHHARANHPDPTAAELREFLKGAHRTLRRATKRATPLRLDTLQAIGRHLTSEPLDSKRSARRLIAILYGDEVGLSDIANLSVGDLTITNAALHINVDNDTVTYVGTGGPQCPVAAATTYLAIHPNPVPDAPLIYNNKGLRARRQTIRSTLNSLASLGATSWDTTKPLTPDIRSRLIAGAIEDPIAIRDHALLAVGYAAALRRDELVRLSENSLIWNNDRTAVTLELWITKTNQTGRHPDRVAIHTTNNPATCPIAALERLIDLRHRYGHTDPTTALFTSIHRYGHLNPKALSGQGVTDIIRQRVQQVTSTDVSGYSGHSMRRGFCTDAAHSGKSALEIASHTRHKSLNIVQRYVDDANRLDPDFNPQAHLMRRVS